MMLSVRADADRGGLLRSLVETIRGQRIAAVVAGLGFGVLLIAGIGTCRARASRVWPTPMRAAMYGLAALIFTKYLWAFELTSAPLITAALGRWCWHRERFERRKSQRELAENASGHRRRGRLPIHQAQLRCLRSPQRRRHPGATARRLRFRHVRQRDPAPAPRR